MQVKADAFQQYNQAAVLDKLLTQMPEMMRAIAEPLNRVDKITVVSTGSDGQNPSTGVNRLAGDMTSLVAQVPALLESLTGVSLEDLLKHVPETGERYRQRGERVTPARKPEKKEPPTPVVDAEPVNPNGDEAAVSRDGTRDGA
jgi:flotillin